MSKISVNSSNAKGGTLRVVSVGHALFAARVIFATLTLWLLVLRLPNFFFQTPVALVAWPLAETAVMTAAAWVLYVWFAGDRDRQRLGSFAGDRGVRIARALFGLSLIHFGLSHFVSVTVGVCARLAAALSNGASSSRRLC